MPRRATRWSRRDLVDNHPGFVTPSDDEQVSVDELVARASRTLDHGAASSTIVPYRTGRSDAVSDLLLLRRLVCTNGRAGFWRTKCLQPE
jgi:hypothetical protein